MSVYENMVLSLFGVIAPKYLIISVYQRLLTEKFFVSTEVCRLQYRLSIK